MFKNKDKQLSYKQLKPGRQILPRLDPGYTAQTLLVTSPGCEDRPGKKRNMRFSTISREPSSHSRSLLQHQGSRSNCKAKSTQVIKWVKRGNVGDMDKREVGARARERERQREQERIYSNPKHQTILAAREPRDTDDKKLNKTRTDMRLGSVGSMGKKQPLVDGRKGEKRQDRDKGEEDRSKSPYMLSNSERIEYIRTINCRKTNRNIINFRREKCFMSADNIVVENGEDDAGGSGNAGEVEDHDGVNMGGETPNQVFRQENGSVRLITEDIERAWRKYERNQGQSRVKSNYEIESYVTLVAVPLLQNTPKPESKAFRKSKKGEASSDSRHYEYNFLFQEEKEVSVGAEPSITLRRKDKRQKGVTPPRPIKQGK